MTIKAKIVADSIANDVRITTMQLMYPRFIHQEFMTHRVFSRNASSSRAIPVETMLNDIAKNPAMPIHWGKNESGMQAGEELNVYVQTEKIHGVDRGPEDTWYQAMYAAVDIADDFATAGYHKQLVNRLTEPFQHIRVVVTATEWSNFFALRLHPAAQPEIQELARVMKKAMDESVPKNLSLFSGMHLPYVSDEARHHLSNVTCARLSVARCARVSYLNHDNTEPDYQKDYALHDMLLEYKHMSPFEHVATPMPHLIENSESWVTGVTHCDKNHDMWSGNFRGWIQYRQTL